MTSVACNLCGADDYTVLFQAGVAQPSQIVRCNHCSFMYAYPLAHGADIDSIPSWDPDLVYRQVKEQESHRVEKQTLQRRDYDVTRRFLAERHPQRGKLVEVGSSLGYLLDYFRRDGWDVSGVEPNRGFALYAQREFGALRHSDDTWRIRHCARIGRRPVDDACHRARAESKCSVPRGAPSAEAWRHFRA